MILIFWLLVAIASVYGIAATMLVDGGGCIFFGGYFIGIACYAVVAKYNQEQSK